LKRPVRRRIEVDNRRRAIARERCVMEKSGQLSIRDQALLVLACALIFSIAIAAAGYLGAGQTRDKIAAFAADGAVADGVVTGKRVDMVMASKASVYWLQVAFKTDQGADRLDSLVVANSIYDRYAVHDPVPVSYVRSRPDWFYVPGAEPTTRDAGICDGMFKYGAVAGVASLLGLVDLFSAGRGGGAPKGRPATAPSARAASPAVSTERRTEFGTRGRT